MEQETERKNSSLSRTVADGDGRKNGNGEGNVVRSGKAEKPKDDPATAYYTELAGAFRVLKILSVVAMFIIAVLTFFLYRRELTIENFNYILRYASSDVGFDYTASNKITYNVAPDARLAYLKGDLAVIAKDSFRVYEFTGQSLVNDRISFLNPTVKVGGGYALAYDVTGKELRLYNSNICLFEKNFPYGITDAYVRDDGIFAVATSGDFVLSRTVVIGADYSECYEVASKDKMTVACALPNSSQFLDVVMLNAVDGEFVSYVRRYDIASESDSFANEVKLYGEFPLKLFSSKDNVAVLTDKALHFYDNSLTPISSMAVDAERLEHFYETDSCIAYSYKRELDGKTPLEIFLRNGKMLSLDEPHGKIISMSENGNDLYFLEKGKLHLRTLDAANGVLVKKPVSELLTDESYTEVFAQSQSKYILASVNGAGRFE